MCLDKERGEGEREAFTSRASRGPDIMPEDMPVSVRHTSYPPSVTKALIPAHTREGVLYFVSASLHV